MNGTGFRARICTFALVATLPVSLSLHGSVQAREAAPRGNGPMCSARPEAQVRSSMTLASTAGFGGYNQGLDMRDDEGYNADYLFGMTKGVASSAMSPAVKPLLFLFTVPLDIVLLPFTAIAGFF